MQERRAHMSRELIGDLSKVRLLELVRPLVEEKRSGMVAIEGVGSPELYFEGGSIVHGKIDTLSGDEAVLAIMDLDNGRVRFDWRISPEKLTVSMTNEQLISNWTQREEEWRKIKAEVPSPEAIFSIVVDSCGGDRTIPEKQWGVLALCNEMRSVSEIAEQLGRSIFDVSQTICEMVELGILKLSKISELSRKRLKETIDETFFVAVETALKRVLGPIARIIVNDTIAAFEESRDAFPKDQVEDFIRTLCDQVVDDDKRERFGKAVYVAWLSALENG
jgi:DNA-binding transcriptional regulator GbsR (MarR family)